MTSDSSRKRRGPAGLDDAQTARAVALYTKQGLGITVIATRFSCSKHAVRNALIRAGVTFDKVDSRAYSDDGRRVPATAKP